MISADLAYRRTAAEGASGFGLLVALYDTLAGDLRRATEAQRASDIERRSREANHAFAVIGLLEDSVRRGTGGDLADQLVAFYASLRRDLIAAQVSNSADMLEELMTKVLRIRESWQKADLCATASAQGSLPPVAMKGSDGYPSFQPKNSAGNWSF
ncbi:MAG: flagellar export chaperone FliS [Terracidiphilus sp.]|jgi:flagellar protein FliS